MSHKLQAFLKNFAFSVVLLTIAVACENCTAVRLHTLPASSTSSSSTSAPPSNASLINDAREITIPTNMTAWGWLDVTKNGAQVQTGKIPNLGCPDAVPNKSDADSVNQTTRAIQCRLDNLGFYTNPGALYLPAGSYYINQTLAITNGYWAPNARGTYVYTQWGNGIGRSNWTGLVHIMGENPLTTQIIWVGTCGPDPNINVSGVTKYNDIFYVNGVAPLTIERLTIDGKNCAGDGIDMVSKPSVISPVSLNELYIQNLKEVGVVGDRFAHTLAGLNFTFTFKILKLCVHRKIHVMNI